MPRPRACPHCGASCTHHTGTYCHECGEELILACLDGTKSECSGPVEYRMALSATGKSFPRCDRHWSDRLDEQDRINRTYPEQPPSDWSPLDAGEHWDEDY